MKWGFVPGSFLGAGLGILVGSITSGSMGLVFGIVRLGYVKIK